MRLRSFSLLLFAAPLLAQNPSDFFESKIRPVLTERCFGCHSSALPTPMAGLRLDTNAGLKTVRGKLLTALSYTDPALQMPPTGKLPDNVIADFKSWLAAGAFDPRVDAPTQAAVPAPLRGMSIEDGRKWWAFQKVAEMTAPKVKDAKWSKTKIDSFILSALEAKNLKPSSAADPRALIERVYIDLVGFKPTYEEINAFVNDHSPNAYEKLVDRLLASDHYGERWGRHWLDVARFGEDNPTSEATNPGYPLAFRYRDWVIEALNKDVPYDKFIKLQLAADLMPNVPRDDMRALGYLGAAPVYHKDRRLSQDVVGGFLADDFDERVDAVSRGILGMTVACARCHDHKFDPILTKDYYGLVGVFASTMRAERPLADLDPKLETRYMWIQNRLFDLRYAADLLTNEASTVVDSAPRVATWKAEIEALHQEMEPLRERYPDLVASLDRYWTFPPPRTPGQPQQRPAAAATPPPPRPFMQAVFDAAQYTDGTDKQVTWILIKPGESRDFPVLRAGLVTAPGDIVPRHFPTVLAQGDPNFGGTGSGRLEFANRIFSDSPSLAARVIVNRVWEWHFGRPIVGTPSDYGKQGEKPTHPALLDDLAARFIAHGWSLKWLNREIMMSAVYQQSSAPRPDAEQVDQINSLYWRMSPRRLDVESFRDSILRAAGTLDYTMYGPSEDVDRPASVRRTVYGRVSRSRLSNLLKLYDFPDPMMTSPGRDLTTTSLQQLFVLNSQFMREQSAAVAKVATAQLDDAAQIALLYHRILARDPSSNELTLAANYLKLGTLEQYAQVLFATNEEILWP